MSDDPEIKFSFPPSQELRDLARDTQGPAPTMITREELLEAKNLELQRQVIVHERALFLANSDRRLDTLGQQTRAYQEKIEKRYGIDLTHATIQDDGRIDLPMV